jgi:hypothetical protein
MVIFLIVFFIIIHETNMHNNFLKMDMNIQ